VLFPGLCVLLKSCCSLVSQSQEMTFASTHEAGDVFPLLIGTKILVHTLSRGRLGKTGRVSGIQKDAGGGLRSTRSLKKKEY